MAGQSVSGLRVSEMAMQSLSVGSAKAHRRPGAQPSYDARVTRA